jgi:internalin A
LRGHALLRAVLSRSTPESNASKGPVMRHLLLICLWVLPACQSDPHPLEPEPDISVLIDHTTFADFALERAVRQALSHERGPLAEDELLSLKTLDLSPYAPGSLDGIERLQNVHRLRLKDSQLTSAALSSLAKLAQLDTLDLSNNRIGDLAPLSSLTNLRLLVLSQNSIRDLSPLTPLTQLQTLDFDNNFVSDLAPLRSLRSLRQLNFDNNLVRDIAPLTSLPLLQRIELSGNPLERSSFAVLRQRGVEVTYYTQALTISDERLEEGIRSAIDKDIGPLEEEDFLKVRALTVRGAVESLRGIEHLHNLEVLTVRGSRAVLNDLSPLFDLTGLREVHVISAPVFNLRPLRELRSLTRLRVVFGNLQHLEGIENMFELRELSVAVNQIVDIRPLNRVLRLQTLDLSSNVISDLTSLGRLRGVTQLNISSNQIEDLSPLIRMTSLATLRISNNQIKDLSPLLEIESLEVLHLGNNPFSETSRNEHIPALRAQGVRVFGIL